MLPRDPFMLLSVVNTKLRDTFSSLADLCEQEEADEGELVATLRALGYEYDEEQNAFKRA